MIVRIFQVTTHPGKEADFAKFFTEVAIPMMRAQDGLLHLVPALPRAESP